MLTEKDIEDFEELFKDTVVSYVGIQLLPTADKQSITATIPVNKRTSRHGDLLNGGVSLLLAETIAGLGSCHLCAVDEDAVGVQVSANHVKAALLGDLLTGVATIEHKGRQLHTWNVQITNAAGQLISTARVLNMVVKKRK